MERVRALRRRRRPQSLLGLHNDAVLPVLRCRVPAGAMDGPGGRAPGALRRKVLLVPSGSGAEAHRLQQARGGLASISIRSGRRRQASQLQHWRSALDPHKVYCHNMKFS